LAYDKNFTNTMEGMRDPLRPLPGSATGSIAYAVFQWPRIAYPQCFCQLGSSW